MCGGQLDFNQGDLMTTCPYCNTVQTLPKISNDEKIEQLYSFANSYLLSNEFDKAERMFLEIVALNPDDAEGYWQLAMCKYGITYVDDPQKGHRVPTINRTYYSSILDDENYKKALSLATAGQKNIYIKTAEYIDEVQKGIVSISRKEKPYDIFICYKETDGSGGRTEESIRAQELYQKLTEQGYKVFFSRITLESKIGLEYEPYIFAALTSSKVMLCIGSSKDNFEAVWVKNEWSRYLRLIENGDSKTLIPIILNGASLPEEFANLPCQDMNTNGFEQELIRGIKKIIPTPVEELARKKKRNKRIKIGVAVASVCLVIAAVLSVPYIQKKQQYDAAVELYTLNKYPESAFAFRLLDDFKDSQDKALEADLSWRKSVSNIAYDQFEAFNALAGGFGKCEAAREGVYIDENGNAQVFLSKMSDTSGEVDTEHGKLCDIVGLYDDGFLCYNPSSDTGKIEIASDVIQAFETCEGYVYLKNDGTVGAKKYKDINKDSYYNGSENSVDWADITKGWTDVCRLVYFQRNDITNYYNEILIGIKLDGTFYAYSKVDGYAEIDSSIFGDVSDVKDAAVSLTFHTASDGTYINNIMVAFLNSEGSVRLFIADEFQSDKFVEQEIDFQKKVIDVSFTPNKNAMNMLCNDGKVYYYDIYEQSINEYSVGDGNVYINEYMTINKNGEPRYFDMFNDDRCLPDTFKARVYEEFTERLD